MNPQFERLAIEIINERDQLTVEHGGFDTPNSLPPIAPGANST